MKQAAGKKLLVIEDSSSDVFLLEAMLRSEYGENLKIVHVTRLIDGFKRIDDEFFDAILLDLNLPDIDGIASVSALHAEAPDTPIIVYSGMENPRLRNEAYLCGAKDYLVKGYATGPSLQRAITALQQPSCS